MNNVQTEKLSQFLNLPHTVPWVGYPGNYALGSGTVLASGRTNGIWTHLVGPAYTMGSYIKKERKKLIIEGKQYTLQAPMYRLEGTGIFCSTNFVGGLIVKLIDFCVVGQSQLYRMIAVYNPNTQAVQCQPYTELKEMQGVTFSQENTCVQLGHKHLKLYIGYDCHTEIRRNYDETVLTGETIRIKPDGICSFTLCHSDKINPEYNGIAELHRAVDEWQRWVKQGWDLNHIKDQKARTIVEGAKVLIRMQQGQDGGVMAAPTPTCCSYVRDNHSAMRGMLAVGYTDEVRRYLLFMYNKFLKLRSEGKFGIPTAAPVCREDETCFLGFGDDRNWSCESPGLLVLTAAAYYRATGDVQTLDQIKDVLDYAIKVQLDFAREHDWKLIFNGDETESGGCGILLEEEIRAEDQLYSLPSQLIAIASLEFYMQYLQSKGIDALAEYEKDLEQLYRSLEENYWREDLGLYHWYRDEKGGWPKTFTTNYHIMPLYFGLKDKQKAASSALAMKQFMNDHGFLPIQANGENNDFTGHTMGYLLYALTLLDDPMKETVYQKLINGGLTDCWGMWNEAYYDDGQPQGGEHTWDGTMHNLRPFETGTNIEAIIQYWKAKEKETV